AVPGGDRRPQFAVDVARGLVPAVDGAAQCNVPSSALDRDWVTGANRPNAYGSRCRLAGHELPPEGPAQGDLRGGDRHEVVGLGHDQRLESEAVLDVGQAVATRGQVAEGPIEVVQRRAQGVGQRQAGGQAVAQVYADHLGVVFGVEAVT